MMPGVLKSVQIFITQKTRQQKLKTKGLFMEFTLTILCVEGLFEVFIHKRCFTLFKRVDIYLKH